MVADLYAHSLVNDTATAMPAKEAVSYLGKNGKNILIVVNEPRVPYLPDEALAFLTKILSACQLGLLDVAIVNWSRLAECDALSLMDKMKAQAVILFDVEPGQFGLESVSLFAVQHNNGRQFVVAPSLKVIEKTKEAKSQLWIALKQLFCI